MRTTLSRVIPVVVSMLLISTVLLIAMGKLMLPRILWRLSRSEKVMTNWRSCSVKFERAEEAVTKTSFNDYPNSGINETFTVSRKEPLFSTVTHLLFSLWHEGWMTWHPSDPVKHWHICLSLQFWAMKVTI